jgi:hypothetical protein
MTPQGTKAALLELQQAAIARSPHVLDGELDEQEEAEGLKVRAQELGLPLNEDVAHVIRSGLQGHEAIPDKPAALRAIMHEAPPYEPNGHAHAVVDIGPEPPPADPADFGTEPPAEPAGDHPAKAFPS